MSEKTKISKLWLVVIVITFIISVSCVCGGEDLPIPDLFGDKDDNSDSNSNPPIVNGALMSDDFSDPNSGWEVGEYEGGTIGYKNGQYSVLSSMTDMVMWGAASRDFSDVIINVDATQTQAPGNNNNDYGIMCRVQFNGDGYSFNISGDGWYSIQKASNDSFIDLVEWTESSAIKQGNATNHMRAVCDGDKLVLFVNGQLLGEATDSTYSSGDIALSATTYESEATEILFDNIVVKAAK